MTPRRFFLLFVAGTLLGLAGILLINLALHNRSATERHMVERVIARTLLEGKTVLPPPGIDELALRWHMIDQLKQAPELVVLASSHGLLLSRELLPVRSLQNYSVSGGTISEHLISSSLLVEKKLRPKIWFIGLDPWFFNKDTDFEMWKLRGEDMVRIETLLANQGSPKLPPLFAKTWEKSSSERLIFRVALGPMTDWFDDHGRAFTFSPTTIPAGERIQANVLLPEGAYRFSSEAAKDGDPSSTALAQRQFKTNIDRHRYGSYRALDEDLWAYFLRWLDYCQQDGAQIWLMLPPYHPAIYGEILKSDENHLIEIERRILALAPQRGYKVFGSYDPKKLALSADSFSDGDHLNQAGFVKVLAPVTEEISKLGLAEKR